LTQPIITLTTDYGATDHLVGAMKGVILNINPDAKVVDVSHSVIPYDILDGALMIGQAYRFYPPRTIHVVVVDPGVGTQRRAILVSGEQQYFVAPDNGVLSVVYERELSFTVRHITSEHYFLHPVSNTFHGRDVFAPVAAWLSKVWQTSSFGEEVHDFVRFSLPKPKITGNTVKGVVLRVDAFGNVLTNLTPEDVPQLVAPGAAFKLRVGNGEISKYVQTFAQGAPQEAIVLTGSSGFIEIAVNHGNAAKKLGAQRGAEVTMELG
jgi:S-adenosyl-L-methionine hydrolase (adenosine-forming)